MLKVTQYFLASIKLLVAVSLFASLAGCYDFARWQHEAANAEAAEHRAAIIKAYRFCLEKYANDPKLQKENCEVYTQSLLAIDVRGGK
jgi:hypothetical protein